LIGGAGSPQLGITEETLSSGAVSFNTSALPGGTYTATAQYGGDGKFGASNSNGVVLTVTQEHSLTTATLYDCNPNVFPAIPCGSTTVVYGSPYIVRVDVTNSAGQECTSNAALGCPTGIVFLTDNLGPLNDFNGGTNNSSNLVNGVGFLEDQPIQLPVGIHSIVASYQGDVSFASSTSAALGITVTKAPTTTVVSGFPNVIAAGVSTQLTAFVDTASSGVSPTGTVTFFEGGALLGSGNCSATKDTLGAAAANCTLTTSLSGLPAVPVNQPQMRRFILGPGFYFAMFFMAAALILSRLVARKRRSLVFLGLVLFAVGLTSLGCGGSSGGGGGGGGGGSKTVTITATYNGDANYTGSNSPGQSVTVN
ncbi:MAG TPA: Ig-like domain-containing protein, partial [Candidatus Acidoferrum sp.]|nr:Ig-like domain-containing protein [Candidatus Acidoferrum sp.]